MKDKDFLLWLAERLESVHGIYVTVEPPNSDYTHKLRAIANALPPEQETPNVSGQVCVGCKETH